MTNVVLTKMGVSGLKHIDGRAVTIERRAIIDSVSVAVQVA